MAEMLLSIFINFCSTPHPTTNPPPLYGTLVMHLLHLGLKTVRNGGICLSVKPYSKFFAGCYYREISERAARGTMCMQYILHSKQQNYACDHIASLVYALSVVAMKVLCCLFQLLPLSKGRIQDKIVGRLMKGFYFSAKTVDY